jgi:hypothetical protein
MLAQNTAQMARQASQMMRRSKSRVGFIVSRTDIGGNGWPATRVQSVGVQSDLVSSPPPIVRQNPASRLKSASRFRRELVKIDCVCI